MKIVCDDGTKTVTDLEYQWLKTEGHLVDTSSHPQLGEIYDGLIWGLTTLLATMPAGWGPVVVPPPAVPPGDNTLDGLIGELEEIAQMLNEVISNLKNI